MKSFIAFGDLMLRLDARDHERLVQANRFDVKYTGAEANSGVLFASLGIPAKAVSKVPASPLGDACIAYLRKYGLDTTHVARGGERLGILYVETRAAQRPSTATYDRTGSSFATSSTVDYDWDAILCDLTWFHLAGTAPAFGPNVRAALTEGLQEAKKREILVSCDLNYRAKLWSKEEAREVMTDLAQYIDVLFGNEEDAETVFGVHAEGSDVTQGELHLDSYRKVAQQLRERYGFNKVATSLRQSLSASHNKWGGLLATHEGEYLSRTYDVAPIVDRVGDGDSFAGGLIYGLMNEWDSQTTVEFAAAASCLKHSIPVDFALLSETEIARLLDGDASG